MSKAIIVDDDYIVAQGLSELTSWKDFDMEVGGVAYDGKSALSLIKDVRPDLIFTDIRMPGMNGLELIRQSKQYVPDATFVIISGFNDFEYIRSALRLNVFDYIDKPITVEKMRDVLTRFKASVKTLSIQSDADAVRTCLTQCMQVCLLPDPRDGELNAVWENWAGGIPKFSTLLVARVECDERDTFGRLEHDMGLALKDAPFHMAALRGAKGGYLAFCAVSDSDADALLNRLHSVCDQIEESGMVLHTGVSQNHYSVGELALAVREAGSALDYAVFFDEHYASVDDVECGANLPATLKTSEQSITFSMRLGDRNTVNILIESIINSMIDSGVSMELFCHEVLELISLGTRVLREAGIQYSTSQQPPYIEIQRYRSAEELRVWLTRQYCGMMEALEAQNQSVGRKSVQKAKEYIDRHFERPITLESLAGICNMNPTYFSMLFKAQTGKTYIKYIGQVRMEQARKMLLGGMSIKRVSESVGFTSQRYFSDRFKGYWGCTPTQLREKMENERGYSDEDV